MLNHILMYGGFPEVKQLSLFQQLRFFCFECIFAEDQCSLQGNASDIIMLVFLKLISYPVILKRSLLDDTKVTSASRNPLALMVNNSAVKTPAILPANPLWFPVCCKPIVVSCQNFLQLFLSLHLSTEGVHSNQGVTSAVKQPELQGAAWCDTPAGR